MSNPPAIPRVVTTGQGEYPATAFPKLDQADQALLGYSKTIEDRLAALERYNVTVLGTLGQVTTDNQALPYSLRSSVWSSDTRLSQLKIYDAAGLTVEAADVMARDANGVPTRVIVAMRSTTSNSASQVFVAIFNYDPASNALTLASAPTAVVPGTSGSLGSSGSTFFLTATGPTTARFGSGYTPYSNIGNPDNDQDITCDANGANISLGPALSVYGRLSYYTSEGVPRQRNRRGYLVGQATFVYPMVGYTYNGNAPNNQGGIGFSGFNRMFRVAGDTNCIQYNVGNCCWQYNGDMLVDYLGNGRFVSLGYAPVLGTGSRFVVRNHIIDDVKVESREVMLPYTYNSTQGIFAMSGAVSLAKFYDGTFNRTCAVLTNADGSMVAPSNGEDHTGLFANNAWLFGLQFKADTLGVLTYNSGFSHTLSYVKADPTKVGTDPILSQSPAAGAAFNLNIGLGGTAVSLGAAIKLSTNAASDDWLFIGASSGTGGTVFAEAHRLGS